MAAEFLHPFLQCMTSICKILLLNKYVVCIVGGHSKDAYTGIGQTGGDTTEDADEREIQILS